MEVTLRRFSHCHEHVWKLVLCKAESNFARCFVWVRNLVSHIEGGGVFENRVLRKIFRRVTGEWRRLHNEEHYNVYPS